MGTGCFGGLVGTLHMNSLRSADLNSRFPGLLTAILAQQD